MGEFTESST